MLWDLSFSGKWEDLDHALYFFIMYQKRIIFHSGRKDGKKEYTLQWDSVTSYTQSACQQLSYFNEQKLAIETCVKIMGLYVNVIPKVNELNVFWFEVFQEMRKLRPCFVFLYNVSENDHSSQRQKRWQKELPKLEESSDTPFFGLPTENNLSLHRME